MYKKRCSFLGFFLIECVVYVALTSLLSIIMVAWLQRVQNMITVASTRIHTQTQQDVALDLLVRDLSMAPAHEDSWKVNSDHELIWAMDTPERKDIGWLFQEGKLYRLEGVYTKKTMSWHEKTKSLVSDTFNKITFSFTQKKNVKTTITVTYPTGQRFVTVRNGFI